jgi:hypothetical protein
MRLTGPRGELPMLYRAIFGIVPMILIALFATGAIPLSSVMPTSEYRSSAVRAGDKTADARPAWDRPAKQVPGAAITPGEVTEVFDSVDASLDAEIKRRAPEERRQKERIRQLHQQQRTPVPGGWGR